MVVWSKLLRLKKLMRKMRRKAYWAVAGEGSVRPHYSHRFVTKLPDGVFLVKLKRISCGTTSGGDRCSSVSTVIVEGLMNNAGERNSTKR